MCERGINHGIDVFQSTKRDVNTLATGSFPTRLNDGRKDHQKQGCGYLAKREELLPFGY